MKKTEKSIRKTTRSWKKSSGKSRRIKKKRAEEQKKFDEETQAGIKLLEQANLNKQLEDSTRKRSLLDEQIALLEEGVNAEQAAETKKNDNTAESNKIKIKQEEELAAAKRNINSLAIDSAKGLVGLLAGLGEQNKDLQRGALLANSALSIAEIINNTNVGSSKEVATKGVFGLGTSTLLYAKMAISIGSVVAATAKGLAALGGGGAPSGAGAGATGAGGAAPQFNVVGQGGANQLAQSLGNQEQQPVQAYVVAGAVTTGQALNRNIINNASMG